MRAAFTNEPVLAWHEAAGEALLPDLPPREVVRSFAVLSGHETYWRLVAEQHWSLSVYRRWLRRLRYRAGLRHGVPAQHPRRHAAAAAEPSVTGRVRPFCGELPVAGALLRGR